MLPGLVLGRGTRQAQQAGSAPSDQLSLPTASRGSRSFAAAQQRMRELRTGQSAVLTPVELRNSVTQASWQQQQQPSASIAPQDGSQPEQPSPRQTQPSGPVWLRPTWQQQPSASAQAQQDTQPQQAAPEQLEPRGDASPQVSWNSDEQPPSGDERGGPELSQGTAPAPSAFAFQLPIAPSNDGSLMQPGWDSPQQPAGASATPSSPQLALEFPHLFAQLPLPAELVLGGTAGQSLGLQQPAGSAAALQLPGLLPLSGLPADAGQQAPAGSSAAPAALALSARQQQREVQHAGSQRFAQPRRAAIALDAPLLQVSVHSQLHLSGTGSSSPPGCSSVSVCHELAAPGRAACSDVS